MPVDRMDGGAPKKPAPASSSAIIARARPSQILRGILCRLAGTVTHVATAENVVALTFDDGPDPVTTPALLKILAAHGAKATFFMLGENAARYPEVVEAVRADGHAIGNHSWNHPSFPLISKSNLAHQIRRCSHSLQGNDLLLFRPPYGHQTALTQLMIRLMGYRVVTWNVVLPDWLDHSGEQLANMAAHQIRPGSILLMHDGLMDFIEDRFTDRSPTLEAVERILGTFSNQYEFVTIPELMERGNPVQTNWLMKPDLHLLNSLKRQRGIPRRYIGTEMVGSWLGYNR
ncbi:MAG: polysaccharide deacetylase family protein [Verrucomicrobiota bacterium]